MMNKLTIILSLAFAFQVGLAAQQMEPVKWKFDAEKSTDGTHTLTFTAEIEKNWVIYGMEELDDGPIPTSINFEKGTYELVGDLNTESESSITDDPLFMVKLEKFKTEASFTQAIKISEPTTVSGWVTFMTCDGERCLPPKDIDFTFDLK